MRITWTRISIGGRLLPMPENIRVYGNNQALPAGVETDIWDLGGVYPWPTEALPLRVRAGGNAADTIFGAGVEVLFLRGLDDDFNPIEDTLVLAGAAESAPTAQSFRRVNLIVAVQSGTYGGLNAGNIIVETTGGTAVGHMVANSGVAHMSMYTIPANKKGYLTAVEMAVPGNKAATLRWKVRRAADIVGFGQAATVVTMEFLELLGPLVLPRREVALPEKTDIWLSAVAAPGGSSCSCEYQLELWP